MVESFCDAVKWSSSKYEGQDFLTPVVALTMASMGVSPLCIKLTPECLTKVERSNEQVDSNRTGCIAIEH